MNPVRQEDEPRVLLARAEGFLHRCDWESCTRCLDELLVRAQATDTAVWAAEAAMLRVRLLLERRDFEQAAHWDGCALAEARLSGDAELPLRAELTGVAVSLALAATDNAWHTLEQVRHALTRLETVSDQLRFEFHRARSHAHIAMGHQQEALDEAELCLQAAGRWGDPRAMAAALGNVAGRWFALGYRQLSDAESDAAARSLSAAVELGERAVAAADAVGSVWLNLANLNNLCGAATALRDRVHARATYARLEDLSRESGVLLHLVFAAIHMARLLQHEERAEEALALIEHGLSQASAISARRAVAVLNLIASELHEQRGDFAGALVAFKRYHAADQDERGERAEQLSRVSVVREAAEQARAEAQALRKANADLSHQALTDPLTGIGNRRHLDDVLRALLARATAAGQPAGFLVLLDIDHFKQVNDRYSHGVGDQVLRELASLLVQQCRQSDLAARWGGEEFALLLHGLELAQAQSVCERVRQTVQQHPWSALAPGLAVTISLGLAALPNGTDAATTFHRCDLALYRAKREGRNRVCIAERAPP